MSPVSKLKILIEKKKMKSMEQSHMLLLLFCQRKKEKGRRRKEGSQKEGSEVKVFQKIILKILLLKWGMITRDSPEN